MSALWTSKEAAMATGGHSTQEWQANSVSIDTRTLEPGALFIALKGDRDGHEFVAESFKRGAAAALVSKKPNDISASVPRECMPLLGRFLMKIKMDRWPERRPKGAGRRPR